MIAKAMHAKADKPNLQNAGTTNPPHVGSMVYSKK
jgi:hypothetical protein